jgi:hypothetical protein
MQFYQYDKYDNKLYEVNSTMQSWESEVSNNTKSTTKFSSITELAISLKRQQNNDRHKTTVHTTNSK